MGPAVVGLVLGLAMASAIAREAAVPAASPKRMEERIQALSRFGANPEGGVSRVAFSEADIQGREYIKGLMREAGLQVRVDTAGNVIGRREGREPSLPAILFGSHIDSVPGGGNYDGDVGVIGALEVAQLLHDHAIATRHPLEVVSFTDEEGGLVGSLAMTGRLTAEALDVVSHSGKTIRDGIRAVGGIPTGSTSRVAFPATSGPSSSCTSSRVPSCTRRAPPSASWRESSAFGGGRWSWKASPTMPAPPP